MERMWPGRLKRKKSEINDVYKFFGNIVIWRIFSRLKNSSNVKKSFGDLQNTYLLTFLDLNIALSVSFGSVKCWANSPQIQDEAYKTSKAVELCVPNMCWFSISKAIWPTQKGRIEATRIATSIICEAINFPCLVPPSIRVNSTRTVMYHSKFVICW